MKFFRDPYNIYIGMIALVLTLPILAPLCLKLSEVAPIFELPARGIYFIYSFTCHQFHYRSLHVFDYQFAWCARDTGIWAGLLVGAVLAKRRSFTGLRWYWVLPFIVPIALDGGVQTIATVVGLDNVYGSTANIAYQSNNLFRFMTGSLFGLGASLWLSPKIAGGLTTTQKFGWLQGKWGSFVRRVWPRGAIRLRHIVALAAILFMGYFGLVQVWAVTSPAYPPANALDLAVKTPPENLFIRRATGVCPAVAPDIFNFDCFFRR